MVSKAHAEAMLGTLYDYAPYAWIITKDRLWEDTEYCEHEVDTDGICLYCYGSSEVGTRGPRQATPVQISLANACGQRFRILDDDGNVYYEGYCWSSAGNSPDLLGEEHFGPLEDFGMPNAGATEIQYKSGVWETL